MAKPHAESTPDDNRIRTDTRQPPPLRLRIAPHPKAHMHKKAFCFPHPENRRLFAMTAEAYCADDQRISDSDARKRRSMRLPQQRPKQRAQTARQR